MGKCFQHFLGHLECPNKKVEENGLVTKSSNWSEMSLGWPNTQIKIHKYTNTVWVKLGDRPIMCYIFEKDIVWGPQKQCSQVSDIKIYKYKYTNTQIQFGPKSSTTTSSSSSSNYKSKFPNFAQNNFWFFDLIFTIICFQTLPIMFFWKKLKNVNVTSHHQANINNNIIICSWNSEQSWLL